MVTTNDMATWVERNPLRTWRARTGTTLFSAAVQLGVSMTSISKWEKGAGQPTPENMAALARLTGDAAIAEAWAAWKGEIAQEGQAL